MPLARVSTSARSTSHSPLPPSPRPPTFLPPSHYAEAGGLSPRPRTRNDSLTSSDSPSQYQTQLESRRNSAFMPISSTSDSSFEVGFDSRPVENKRFSISGGGSRSGGSKNKPSKGSTSRQSRLESHMTNLPLVEAQLLPSLRDTIDRMTRPPSRIQNPASPSATNDSEPSLRYSPEPRFQPRLPMTPQPPHTSSESFPSPAVPLTPKPLKSALRAPTPKLRLLSPRKSASSTPGVTDSPRSPAGKGITPIPPTLKVERHLCRLAFNTVSQPPPIAHGPRRSC
ncbi:hypothetical protein B0H10DRAFT_18071 [Mycena sp. CBHHK59/15]|nr:hypothetical protein B0H10DRAFT_18071 [Mycena sp. CBHHK59/15]